MPGRNSKAKRTRFAGHRFTHHAISEVLEPRIVLDSTVVFNEILYNHPTSPNLEWVELHNQMGIDMDLSGWRIDGGVQFGFASGTIIPARGFLVVAANPTALQAATGFAGAIGPYTGVLDNNGEELRLINLNDRLMNSVDYKDNDPWPIAADGSGATLAKRDLNLASEVAANWTVSTQIGGTPGAVNFLTSTTPTAIETPLIGINDPWKYEASGTNLGTAWTGTGPGIDTAWSSGPGLLYSGNAHLQPTAGGLAGAGQGLYGYWPLEQNSGLTANNSVAGGTNGTLINGVTWVTDAQRGQVLNLDGVDGYVTAGTLPTLAPTTNFTWSFWAKPRAAANDVNSVILGNRYPDSGWVKFTPTNFEYRDIAPSFNSTIDIPDLAAGGPWVHQAVVKSGTTMTYYRNGVVTGTATVSGTMPSIPFYFGGDTTLENWGGQIDDVAVWTKNLPAQAIAGLAGGTYTPLTAPTELVSGDNSLGALVFSDDFTADAVNLNKWTVSTQGLENNGPAGYNAPNTTANADRLTLGGTANNQYWFGDSLESVPNFRTDETITAQVDRVSLAGSGTAYRSSLWLYGDAGHYLHFSQNIGEGGWSYNSNDIGGAGTLNPTGGGNNIGAFDALDANTAQHEMKLVYRQSGVGQGIIDIYLDGSLGASQSVTNWPGQVKVLVTGQARAINDSVSAVFDNLKVYAKPPVAIPSVETVQLNDDFTANTINPAVWTTVEYGLETHAPGTGAGYALNTTANDNRLTISGTANTNYWGGLSLQGVQSFNTSSVQTSVTVDRVSLAGSGTAWRSSLWLWADDNHYLHFSQNVNESGWSYNANDVGGTGTLLPTGSGTAIANFNSIAPDAGQHQMKLLYRPTGATSGTIEIYLDGNLGASHNVSNWPSQFKVMLTGQGRASGDTVAAVFDNLKVAQGGPVPLATQLPLGPSTYYFRKEFTFSGDPTRTTFELTPILDDGAVFYLDGQEVYRYNVPEAPATIAYGTLASSETDAPLYLHPVTISAASLQPGSTHVLAVEVHQATANSPDMVFGTTLKARVVPPPSAALAQIAFNEVAAATDAEFKLEIVNNGTTPVDVTGYVVGSSTANPAYTLPAQTLLPGALLVVTEAQLGFHPTTIDRFFLYTAGKAAVLDGATVSNKLQGRSSEYAGRWLLPSAATFGAPNTFAFQRDVVINEIMYHHRPTQQTPTFIESNQEWIELYNRSNAAIDLSGWDFGGGVNFAFPAGTAIAAGSYLVVSNDAAALLTQFPGINVIGNFSGSLSDSGELIELRDAVNNPADIVDYRDEGRWAVGADGNGSSLELRNAFADNSKPEAWSPSNELGRSQWQTYTYSGVAQNTNGDPLQYNEFIMGLLDAGEILIDDISVIQNPAGVPKQLIQNGNFEAGNANFWRLLGNHSHSQVIVDPSNANNRVLRLVATGPTEHMHNHAETTLKDGAAFVSIQDGTTYAISFRARVVTGSNQLNSRLYFNRLSKTTLLTTPTLSGTPGTQNSTFVANAGPTYSDLRHGPVTPQPQVPVIVSVNAADSDGVATMTLWYAIDGGAWSSVAMTSQGGGAYSGSIPGQAASTVVQFYVQGADTLGATSMFPAAGPNSRALFKVNDTQSQPGGLHDFRIIMLTADANLLHTNTNVMSNDRIGSTVVYDDQEVYYDTGVRLKGSERGRNQTVRVGFNVSFDPLNLFRGVHPSVAIDRSGAGNEFSQKEILIKHAIGHAGDIPGMYDDLIRVIAPRTAHTGTAMLQMARFGKEFLDTQYENGSDGTAFEYELIYFPTSTTGGPEGLKIPEPDGVVGVGLQDLGNDKEKYRWHFLIENNRDQDDYSKIIPVLKALGQPAGANFNQQTAALLDVDEWLRSYAIQSLFGIGDNYSTGSQHNAIFYTRPEDNKTLYFPFDMDFSFSNDPNAGVVQNNELSKMLGLGQNVHHYYGHLHDIISTTFNSGYMTPWVNYYDSLLPESLASFNTYIATRATTVTNQINAAVAPITFAITTNGGNDFSVNTPSVTIAGDGWVNVRDIFIDGRPEPLVLTWTDKDSWQASVPLANGANALTFRAKNFQGADVATDTITITTTSGQPSQNDLRITELMYHPGTRTAAEVAAGFTDDDDFEFLEIQNTGNTTVNLAGVELTEGVTFTFAGSAVTSLAPGEYVLVVKNLNAFNLRYDEAGLHVAGQYLGNLNNGGEPIELVNSLHVPIQTFTYFDTWHPSTDGFGPSMVIINPLAPVDSWNDAASWQPSANNGGSPGLSEPTVTIAGRHVFYNNSVYDGDNAAAGTSDDAAIATDKAALLRGQQATFANYTSYNRGLNGLMVDISNLPLPLALSQFAFRVGNENNLANWTAAPAPLSLDVRSLGDNISRATLIWADDAIRGKWLEVTLTIPGLGPSDVFYFGNAVGETGNDPANAFVDASDEIAARNNPKTFTAPATITDHHDFNRDAFVNAADQILARSNATTFTNALNLIIPGGPGFAESLAASSSGNLTTATAPVGLQASSTQASQSFASALAAALASAPQSSAAAVLQSANLPTDLAPSTDSGRLAALAADDVAQAGLSPSAKFEEIVAARLQQVAFDEGLYDWIADELVSGISLERK